MVDIDKGFHTKRALNHIYPIYAISPQLDVGEVHHSVVCNRRVLFEKSMVLAEDLDRLPCLVGHMSSGWTEEDMIAIMGVGGVQKLQADFFLIDGNVNDNEVVGIDTIQQMVESFDMNILAHLHIDVIMHITASIGTVINDRCSWDFEGQRVLSDTISIVGNIRTNDPVEGAIQARAFSSLFLLEIDWKPITKKQLTEYLMEHVYTQRD